MFCAPGHVFSGVECVGSRFHVLCVRTHFRRSRGLRVTFSCFKGVGSLFHVLLSLTHFHRYKDIGSRFLVLRVRTHFWRDRGSRVPFSCFALPDSFSAVPSAPDPIFMFCATGLVFGDTEGVRFCFPLPGHFFGGPVGVGSRFHILRSRTRFRRYRGRWVPI
jgi:hypothetical protein